jgi:hypothetical protein
VKLIDIGAVSFGDRTQFWTFLTKLAPQKTDLQKDMKFLLIGLGIYLSGCPVALGAYLFGFSRRLNAKDWFWPVIFIWPALAVWPVWAAAKGFLAGWNRPPAG